MNLLIIDDDTVDRMNSIRNIKKTGITVNVVEAASAEKGISIARKNTFDIILLDYRLPDMDGLKALKDLRKNTTSNTATVMLSHSNDEALAIACIEAGAQDFILKSEVSSSRLKRAILHAQERFKLEQALRDSNEKLRSLAEKDSLTGLSNRYFFDKSLEEGIAVARRHQTHLALMIFDLDKFKLINDTYGHVSGDTVLKSVATRLNRLIKNEDILCRLGGDEFALLINRLQDTGYIERLIKKIFGALAIPIPLEKENYTVSTSIGIAVYPNCASNASELIKCADAALYEAKKKGLNQFHFYPACNQEKQTNINSSDHYPKKDSSPIA